MNKPEVSRASLGRLPLYLEVLKKLQLQNQKSVSAPVIARELGLGEVQVRKDLCAVSGAGKPKVGYDTNGLVRTLEEFLGYSHPNTAVIIGAGKLGRALLDYGGFADYGLEIAAAFDKACSKTLVSETGKPIYPISIFDGYCQSHPVNIAIITVPCDAAQEVCDAVVKNRIKAIWSFAGTRLKVPEDVTVQYENLALSLAYLNKQIL